MDYYNITLNIKLNTPILDLSLSSQPPNAYFVVLTGGPLITETEDEDGALTPIVVGILRGGGVDCANLIQTNATETGTTKTGKWMRISEFRTWIDDTIRKELAPGRKTLIYCRHA